MSENLNQDDPANGGTYRSRSLNTFIFSEQKPWVKRVIRSYVDRMRVSNFSKSGNVVFSVLLQKALAGCTVYFTMVPNGRADQVISVRTPISQSGEIGSEPAAPVETLSDGDAGQQSVDDSGQYAITRTIISGKDPVDLQQVPPDMLDEVPDPSLVSWSDYSGRCFDADNNLIPDIFCLQLADPIIDEKVRRYASQAAAYDSNILAALPDIVKPTKVVTGLSNDTQIRSKPKSGTNAGAGSAEGASAEDATGYTSFPYSEAQSSRTPVVPKAEVLGPQWDTDKMRGYLASVMLEFLGLVNVPPVDFPEVGTLSQQTQSLVSNREPFVSRMKRIRAEVDAVFDRAGIPELSWELPFPYTPQDIASIGDANGKGVNSETLRSMNLG